MKRYDDPFSSENDRELSEQFLKDGHVIFPVEDPDALNRIRVRTAELAAEHLSCDVPTDAGEFLDRIDQRVSVEKLNDLRLAIFNGLNQESWFRQSYVSLGRRHLDIVVGNELAMQRRINLSIQLPGDDSSLLPVHSDVWSGDSPFEVVLWVPMVACERSKSMFLLPPGPHRDFIERMAEFQDAGSEALFQAIEPHLAWLTVPYGHAVLFTHILMHGNRVNQERTTRWSMNCRFKSVFAPYGSKRLGEFFEPITLRAASRLGLDYKLPQGFDE